LGFMMRTIVLVSQEVSQIPPSSSSGPGRSGRADAQMTSSAGSPEHHLNVAEVDPLGGRLAAARGLGSVMLRRALS
jgi:hypothetical protein